MNEETVAEATPETPPAADPPESEPAPLPTLEDLLAGAVERLMRATSTGDGDAAHAALSDALGAFVLSTAPRYESGLPAEGTDFELIRSDTGIRVEPKTPNGNTLCELWGSYTREMEYRSLQQRVVMLSTVVARQQEQMAKMGKTMDNVLLQFDQIRRKIRF